MEMILMISLLILFAIGVMAMVLGAATREEPIKEPKPILDSAVAHQPSRFFKASTANSVGTLTPVPIETLMLQIENHIRLEKSAAESFVAMPTAELLHFKTKSPLAR